MKSVRKWYVCSLAIAFGVVALMTVACHDDDDDPQPEQGEVIDTPKPVVEYYIMGMVTSKGAGLRGVSVKVGDKNCTTDAEGKFSVTESTTGEYVVEATSTGYLAQKTSVQIAANAENRSVVTVALALTKQSQPEEVNVNSQEETKVEDNSESNQNLPEPGSVAPEQVVEDRPLATMEINIPSGAISTENNQELVTNDKVDISVTTFVPAPEVVSTEVKPAEENKAVEKSIPLAAAQFQPTGLKFEQEVTISIPNPIPGITFPEDDMQLTYLNPATGKWEVEKKDGQNVAVTLNEGVYQAPVTHFSAYAIESKVTSTVGKEEIQKNEVLGQSSRDNSENPKAVTGIVLKYTEKSGWDYEGDMVQAIKTGLGGSPSNATVNAMAAYLKTRMYSLMGSTSGITSTERTYNTVNVNGYTNMVYACYPKIRTTTLTTKVMYNGATKTISISAKRYTGTDHQYKTQTFDPRHSGGQGGSN